jgi:putative MFS transporter
VPRVTDIFDADDELVARLLDPRDDVVLEYPLDRRRAAPEPGEPELPRGRAAADADGESWTRRPGSARPDRSDDSAADQVVEFGASEGPFRTYRRTVSVAADGSGTNRVEQTIDFWLGIPVWGWVFARPVTTRLRRLPEVDAPPRTPWWMPPDRFDLRQSTVLGALCGLSLIAGYLGTLLTQTITYASTEFDASDTAQGVTLAVVRVGVVGSLVLVGLADRRGRRSMLLWSATLACVFTATGALSPGLIALGASQTVARGLSTALAVLIGIVAVEEMPGGSRAYSVSVLAMTGALGAGSAVIAASISDQSVYAWRLLYVLPLFFLFAVRWVSRHLPETRRYLQHEFDQPEPVDERTARSHRRRFALLAASGFLTALFTAPASSFLNEFLRTERGFSSAKVSLFTIATNTPGGIGIVVGGHLADTRGRRIVGAVGLLGGVGATVLMFLAMGAPMWLLSSVGAIVGAATVPALGVYGPELFPTGLRGRANAGLTVLAVAGSSIGLIAAGVLSDSLGGFGSTMAVLAIGPAIVAVLVLTLYPETAHLELEEINPEDARGTPPSGAPPPGGPAPGGAT